MARKAKTEENDLERYTRWYFEELIDNGYVKEIQREPEKLICAWPLKHRRVKYFKKKPNEIETFNLFPEISYTYDFRIVWDKKAEYIFYELVDTDKLADKYRFGNPPFVAQIDYDDDGNEIHISRIDTKPTSAVSQMGGRVSSSYTFPIKQRMLFEKDGIYIDKFIPIPMAGSGLTVAKYVTTFVPKRYFFTDANNSTRLRKAPSWRRTDLNGFIKKRLELIQSKLDFNKSQPKLDL